MSAELRKRVQRICARARTRSWEYRQRDRAKGTWYRLRRVLTEAEAAYAISRQDADALLAEGLESEPVGEELAPARTLVFVSEDRLAQLASRRQVPVRLGSELLAAECLALIRFPRMH